MVYIAQNEKFISEVGKLYDACKDKRSVWMTFKKFTPQVPKQKSKQQLEKSAKAAAASNETKKPATATQKKAVKLPEGCLIRVTDGHKKKLSTIVPQKNLTTFQVTLFNIVKQKMTNLKSVEKKAPAKTNVAAAATQATKTTAAKSAQQVKSKTSSKNV